MKVKKEIRRVEVEILDTPSPYCYMIKEGVVDRAYKVYEKDGRVMVNYLSMYNNEPCGNAIDNSFSVMVGAIPSEAIQITPEEYGKLLLQYSNTLKREASELLQVAEDTKCQEVKLGHIRPRITSIYEPVK